MNSLQSKIYTLIGPGELVLDIRPVETELAEGEYIAETLYSAISPGTECAAYNGMSPLKPGNIYPRLMGYCNMARVIAVRSQADVLKEGDIILTFQSHRTHFKTSVKEFYLKVTDRDNIKALTPVYLYHLGYHAIMTGSVKPGHNTGIIGAGVLGYTTAVMSRISGANTYVFTNQAGGADKLQSKKIVCLKKNAEAFDHIREMTNSVGIDVVINTSNTWEDWHFALQLAAKGATIVNLGFPGRGQELPAFNPLDPLFVYTKSLSIKALCPIDETDAPTHVSRFNMKRNIEYILRLINDRKIDPSEIITDEIDFVSLEEQYRKYSNRSSYMLSTLIHWNN